MSSRPISPVPYNEPAPKRGFTRPKSSFNRRPRRDSSPRHNISDHKIPDKDRGLTYTRFTNSPKFPVSPNKDKERLTKKLHDCKARAKKLQKSMQQSILVVNQEKKDWECREKELVRENEQLKECVEQLKQENCTLKQDLEKMKWEVKELRPHVCPLRLQEKGGRGLEALLQDFWYHLLQAPRPLSKLAICSAVVSQGKCTHSTLQAGFSTFGFYVSHSEALNAIRQMAGAAECEEHLQVSEMDFRQSLQYYQPYLLREDVVGSLRCLALLFALQEVEKEVLGRTMRAVEKVGAKQLRKQLECCCKQLPRKKLRKVVDFLLRGAESISGEEAFARLCAEVPAWKPLKQLGECKDRIITVLRTNRQSLVQILSKAQIILRISEFQAIWKIFGGLDYDEAQLIEASSLKSLLLINPSESVVRLSHLVSVEMVLGWFHDVGVDPFNPIPLPADPEEDEEG